MAQKRNSEVDPEETAYIPPDGSIVVDADPLTKVKNDEATASYPEPVEKLLHYGEPEAVGLEDWPDYLSLGITTEYIPDLLQVIADPALQTSDPDEQDPKYWAPVHAWRTLAQLRDVSAVEPLLQQTEALLNDTSSVDEWALDELPDVYSAIGPAAIPILEHYLTDASPGEFAIAVILTGLRKIAEKYPEQRETIISFSTEQLENFAQNTLELNTGLVSLLTYLKATETLPLIQRVFAADQVDTFMIGLFDVEVAFGLKEYPETDIPDLNHFLRSLTGLKGPESELSGSDSQAHFHPIITPSRSNTPPKGVKNKVTKKAKAKMEKASRKKNRRK